MSRSISTPSTKPESDRAKRPYLWVIALLGVAIAVTAVVSMARGEADSTDVGATEPGQTVLAETNDVSVVGEPLLRFAGDELAAGLPAPQVTGVNFAGEPIVLLEPGTPTVIGFFAHWCPHCQAEVDELSKHLATTGLPDDVKVVAVSTGVDATRGNYPPSAWFDSEGWPAPVLSDDAANSAATSYGLSAFPFWAVVDADGDIVSRSSGGIGPDQFDAFVELARTGG